MASSTPATAESMVTLKVNFQGVTRRAKMPLREMIPSVLDNQIRTFLHIPAGVDTVIERYSDSASMYVVLDPNNMAIYKQLYRAAKAKSKLKLRVSIKNAPKPVTVEDEAEASINATGVSTDNSEEENGSPDVKQEKPSQVADAATAVPTTTNFASPMFSPAPVVEPKQPLAQPAVHRQPPIGFRTGMFCTPQQNRLPVHIVPKVQSPPTAAPTQSSRPHPMFAICCNTCEKTIPDVHYHCSTCDDGDFDLCQSCVDQGNLCYSGDHWLIKRTMRNGLLVNSTTETIPPKPKEKKEEPKREVVPRAGPTMPYSQGYTIRQCGPISRAPVTQASLPPQLPFRHKPLYVNARTCNCCVEESAEHEFLHCNNCEDYDLCKSCFEKDGHGHHPKHTFSPAVAGAVMPDHIAVKMAAGRNQMHNAICDGCDKYINGVRHKCLDCPDWDYCSDCFKHAHFVHAKHRFVPVYEAIMDGAATSSIQPVHIGICCDGALCSVGKAYPSYIRGIRYKCAICHDLDFCANCEASPANDHNKTHPLIKFKTPVRNVSVSTSGEHQNGKQMPAMGDKERANAASKAAEPVKDASAPETNTINTVQTVFDVKPVETPVREETKDEAATEPVQKALNEADLQASFVRDSVVDGTILPANHVFEQVWTLKNEGDVAWPAGCSVKFVGGDYMGNLDPAHPAKIADLLAASESSASETAIAPGEEHSFKVALRTSARAGRFISYWRLTTESGWKFGHRLWCDVSVRAIKSETVSEPASLVAEPAKEQPKEEEETKEAESMKSSTMIFPKLENESPVSSMHEAAPAKSSTAEEKSADSEDYEDADDGWYGSDDGFMTDEEYDILDASDEEFLEEQQRKLLKK